MIYGAVFVELFPRIIIGLVSSMIYSSYPIKLYEFNYSSEKNITIGICLFALLVVSIIICYSHTRILNSSIDHCYVAPNEANIFERLSASMLLVVFLFLIFEVHAIIAVIGFDLSVSKRTYMDFVVHPEIFKVIHALFPVCFLLAASFIMKKTVRGEKIDKKFLAMLVLAFAVMAVYYLLLQRKSYIIRTPLIFFLSPLMIFFAAKKSVNRMIGVFAIGAGFAFFAAFAYQYRTLLSLGEVPSAILDRLLIEGQINYLSFEILFSSSQKLNFFEYFGPFLDPEAGLFSAVYGYARYDLQLRAASGQWTPSGLMPGFIFRVDFWPLYFVIWLAVFWYAGFLLIKSYKKLMLGNVISCFCGIKIAITLFQFVGQGVNFLSSVPFWAYLGVYVISSSGLFSSVMRRRVQWNYRKGEGVTARG